MKRALLSFFALGAFAALSAAPVSYIVSVDSSSIAPGTPGYIEFQFNQANAGTSLAAMAYVGSFTSTGFAFNDATNASFGGVTGSLAAPPLVFDNTVGGANVFDQGVSSFGSSFTFTLTVDGDALGGGATDGSEFFVYLLDSSFQILAGPTTGPAIAGLEITGDGVLVTKSIAEVSSVTPAPEPSTLLLLGSVMALLVARRRR